MRFEPIKHSRIALIGFRGVGKSTVGKMLARKLKLRYISMDEYIERKNGMSIENIVQEGGWTSFRRKETDVLQFFANRQGVMLDTGGGVMEDGEGNLSEKKFNILKNCFYCVYLYMSDDALLERLGRIKKSTHRPALGNANVKDILEKRKPWYEKLANYAISTERLSPGEVANKVLKLIKND